MTECSAHSAHGSDSVSRAYRIGSWLHVSTFEGGKYASTALTTDAARTFARGILALCDEIDGGEVRKAPVVEPLADWERELIESAPAPIKVGDRVDIVRAEACSRHEEGRTGIVDEVDRDDPHLPYRIVDEAGDFIAWVKEVRKVDEPEPAPAFTFATLVDEAKRLLAGTPHTAADIITLARDLADRA
ncbi:hypothetical protein ACFWMJ_23450 [Streptomyces hawaiiensis]|uniref:hypothetical protein n=1 Tax=Streptomyces hawaiiensis TaxID=67305 RepID=UPI003651A6B4